MPSLEPVNYVRKINGLCSRKLRAMLHQAWEHGNNSMNLPNEEAGKLERHDFINELLVRNGLATPKVETNAQSTRVV